LVVWFFGVESCDTGIGAAGIGVLTNTPAGRKYNAYPYAVMTLGSSVLKLQRNPKAVAWLQKSAPRVRRRKFAAVPYPAIC
jgi:hypothetical protein